MGNKKYKEDHKKKGLCVDCSEPAVVGKTRCEKHFERNRIYDNKRNKARKQKYKDENKCPKCSAPLTELDLEDGYIECCNCRQKLHRMQGLPYYIGEQ